MLTSVKMDNGCCSFFKFLVFFHPSCCCCYSPQQWLAYYIPQRSSTLEWSFRLWRLEAIPACILHEAVACNACLWVFFFFCDYAQVPASVFSTSATPCINLQCVEVSLWCCLIFLFSSSSLGLSCYLVWPFCLLYGAVERAWLWLISHFTWGTTKYLRLSWISTALPLGS